MKVVEGNQNPIFHNLRSDILQNSHEESFLKRKSCHLTPHKLAIVHPLSSIHSDKTRLTNNSLRQRTCTDDESV